TPDLVSAVGNVGFAALPGRLAGRARRPLPDGFEAVGVYGTGLSAFVVLPLPRDLGQTVLDSLRHAGGAAGTPSRDRAGVAFSTPLVSVLVIRYRCGRRTYLLAGLDTPTLIRRAAGDLAARIGVALWGDSERAPQGRRTRETRPRDYPAARGTERARSRTH